MSFGYIFFLFSLNIFSISCGRSFTVVLDTTGSMEDEINNVIKTNIGSVVNSINGTDIENYVLVPFKDTYLEAPFITHSPRLFTNHFSTVSISGGSDCPENSLAGIEAALRTSKHDSYIFMFTDAFAKDYDRFQYVETLCKETHSQVIIFLSGFCAPSAVENVNVYYDVAKVCSGVVFRFENTFELRQAFNFMKTVVNTEWTDITPQEKITNYKNLKFLVDSFTTNYMIGVSGSFLSMRVLDSTSQAPILERVLMTRHAMVVHLIEPNPGEYSVNIQGNGDIFMTFYERNYIPFQYGFSSTTPRSLKETSQRPIAELTNYILISVDTSMQLNSIEWLNAGENAKKILFLEEIGKGLYFTNTFVEPGKSFRVWIIGHDKTTQQNIRGSSKFIHPQIIVTNTSWVKPEVEMLDRDSILIDSNTDITLACKITGFPIPNIRWENENDLIMPSKEVLIEIPSVYMSYMTASNVSKNSTFHCKCENSEGYSFQSIDIFVNRTFSFDVIDTPQDTSVEYGGDLTLYCQVMAYPEARIKWYLNSTEIDSYSSKVTIADNSLVVKNVSLDDGGAYQCMAINDVESRNFTAVVSITGLEIPEVEVRENEINVKPGDWIEIDCRITKGKPAPEVSWLFKSPNAFDYEELPTGATIEDGKLKILSAVIENGGIYSCSASNILGTDSKEVILKIQYPPTIKNIELETVTVKEGDSVQLPCAVDAVPEASVRWEMSQDDVSVVLSERHRTDDKHTLLFTAFWNDSGNYHCIAQNDVGKAERTVTVNVLVPPYIESPKPKTIFSRVGNQVDLTCNVLYGNPAASIKWEYIAVDLTSNVINRGNSTLRLANVTQSDAGSYRCIAENQVGMDRIKYILKIQ